MKMYEIKKLSAYALSENDAKNRFVISQLIITYRHDGKLILGSIVWFLRSLSSFLMVSKL